MLGNSPQCLTMTKAELAAYVGVGMATVDQWRAKGILPGPLPGTNRWLKRAVDAGLDKAAGIASNMTKIDTSTPYGRRQARKQQSAQENHGNP